MNTSGSVTITPPSYKGRGQIDLSRIALGLGRLSIKTPGGSIEVTLGESALQLLRSSLDDILGEAMEVVA